MIYNQVLFKSHACYSFNYAVTFFTFCVLNRENVFIVLAKRGIIFVNKNFYSFNKGVYKNDKNNLF